MIYLSPHLFENVNFLENGKRESLFYTKWILIGHSQKLISLPIKYSFYTHGELKLLILKYIEGVEVINIQLKA